VVTFPSCGGAFLLFLCAILVDDDSVEKNKYKIERLLPRPILDEKTLFVSLVRRYRAKRARMRSKERESLWRGGGFAKFLSFEGKENLEIFQREILFFRPELIQMIMIIK